MQTQVRVIRDDEVEQFVKTIENAFGHELRASDIPVFRRKVDMSRMHSAFDGDEIVGTAGVFPFNLRIPGGEVTAAGVTMVGVLPSHRRRGILREMMRVQLDDVHRRGEPLAILWASEESIYQRFGYGLSANHGHIRIERTRTQFLNDPGAVGRVRLVSRDDALKMLPSVYDRIRDETPGMYERSRSWWETHSLFDPEHLRFGASPYFYAVFELDGAPEGYAVYRMRSKWNTEDGTPAGRVEVDEAMGTSPAAIREVWRFLFGIDLTETISAWYLPADFPLLLMMVEPRRLRFGLGESLWLRIVDVGEALSGRSYAAEASIVFEIADAFCPWNEGRWRLDTGAGEARATDDDPDIVVDIGALGAAYLGGHTFVQLERAGRLRAVSTGALERADAAFRVDKAPWCPENF